MPALQNPEERTHGVWARRSACFEIRLEARRLEPGGATGSALVCPAQHRALTQQAPTRIWSYAVSNGLRQPRQRQRL